MNPLNKEQEKRVKLAGLKIDVILAEYELRLSTDGKSFFLYPIELDVEAAKQKTTETT